jgi:hypothetical protein
MISEWWVGKDLEGYDHADLSYYASILLEKPRKTAVNIARLLAEIYTRDLPSTN